MKNEIISALEILKGTGVSIIDAARFARNILDSKTADFKLTDAQYCAKVIMAGIAGIRQKEMAFAEGFALYHKSKEHLRADSLRDILYIGRRLMRANGEFAKANFSELTRAQCEQWLASAFKTAQQFNKARTMLHGLFEFALRREWCDKNPVKLIERKKITEREITPLRLDQTKRLIATAKKLNGGSGAAPAALLLYAGIRPREVRRLSWRDIDLAENAITVRAQCSKTGGARQVEIPAALKRILLARKAAPNTPICPRNWSKHWRKIRDDSGFKGAWVQDILRHTYASYHAKRYANLPRLQLNMGHRDTALLRSRYVNMRGISKSEATAFFM